MRKWETLTETKTIIKSKMIILGMKNHSNTYKNKKINFIMCKALLQISDKMTWQQASVF